MNFVRLSRPDPVAVLRKRMPWFVPEHDSPYLVFSDLALKLGSDHEAGDSQIWSDVAGLLDELASLNDPEINNVLVVGFMEALEHEPGAIDRLGRMVMKRTADVMGLRLQRAFVAESRNLADNQGRSTK